ncbi:MAG: bifunctional 5,10-methylenetetrahydrofolate dehydrogenase/5,10-methenyltetrahydrofolate cyclohydrolase [Coriobacteriales bacterium]|jgi:methylenetetrahydrofolate dehydrogenase (NADP+)/methenyltetrahydrofolate cyclohydrolase|nr:bifunctional 5,10-methylenetetrahydrofolate dehydrogenase/5,10-methenyltetrahydrofolate cyclohydrolase [Coriobacteriales bacterium]
MMQILKGADVVASMNEKTARDAEALRAQGVVPTLAILRVGEREDEIAYERGALKRTELVGIQTRQITLDEQTSQEVLIARLEALNADAGIHGVLLLRPLPPHIDDDVVRNLLAPSKDIDGITDSSIVGVFTGEDSGFPPCTAQACMELLDHYGVALAGKRAVVVGRSLVIGKPVAMMLLARNATVTIAHSRTAELAHVTQEADIVIACVGKPQMLGAAHFSADTTIIDVGINVREDDSLVGDVDFEAASAVPGVALTPVPGGVGAVTTSVLVKHVVEAARRSLV